MPRQMYDGVDPAQVPAGAAIYAGYDDGSWQSLAGLTGTHPGKLYVSICVSATGTGRVLDVEQYDATPEQAPAWAERQRAAGNPYPVVYCNQASGWPAVKAAFAAQKVAEPLYWVAAYVNDPTKVPTIPAGAIALQYYDYGGYDTSVVADYWPGLDPAPKPTAPAPAPSIEENDDMAETIRSLALHPDEYVYVADGEKTAVFGADGYGAPPAKLRVVTWVGSAPDVHDEQAVGGTGPKRLVITLPAGCTAVTVRREDTQAYPIGVRLQ
jgi:hypothetical protein